MSAPSPRRRRLALAVLLLALVAPASAQAGFGIQSLATTAKNRDGSLDFRAGSHPFEFEFDLVMNQDGGGVPEGTLRDLIVDVPQGLAGNPQAVPRCPTADFEGQNSLCPGNTQIGVVNADIVGIEHVENPVYNLTPPAGVAARLGFSLASLNSLQEGSVNPFTNYGLRVSDITLPTDVEIQSISETIWGVPADPAHDPERQCVTSGGVQFKGCSSDSAPIPFLSLPTSCVGTPQTTVAVDSLEEPEVLVKSKPVPFLNENDEAASLEDCEALPFSPTISSQPETAQADSPTGLHFALHVPQHNEPQEGGSEGLATAHLKDVSVALPAGLEVNASAADGLGACALAGPQGINLPGSGEPGEGEAAKCPPSSKVGTVAVKTPLLDHPLPGSVYLAKQVENPFGSLIALYIAVDDPVTGVVVKIPVEVEPDPLTGQLKTFVTENPQLPFEDFSFDFFGGARASLTTPLTCGTYATEAQLTPWSEPEGQAVGQSSSFPIAAGPGGGPCVTSEAQAPNQPSFEAGTIAPLAGAYSPFVLRLTRQNGSQRFAALNLTLPPGLTGKLAGLSECTDAQIAGAEARGGLGEGALEAAQPSCPQSSEVGVVNVGVGSGAPFYVQGHAYLAGPYKGAPLSTVIITPGVAGPFDLGAVVVRAGLYVDESTAQVTAKSDPVPRILHGIPLDVRSIAVQLDRPEFMLNPTSCEAMAVGGEEISTTGAVAPLQNRFQLGGCRGLDFSPRLSLSLKGGMKKTGHPRLRAVLTQPAGQANIARITTILPPSEFIDQFHISNPCTRPQFAAGACPPGSVLGTARAYTPLLDEPLEGKVYFRSNGGERELPDVVADLNGQIHFVAVGFVDSVRGRSKEESRLRTTFAVVPDAPVSKVVIALKGGREGLLENSRNLCSFKPKATVKLTAHNGKTANSSQRVATSCRKRSRKAKHRT